MVISSPCLTDIKNWLVQKQTAFGKDFSNPFTADSLLKTIWFSTHHASHKGSNKDPIDELITRFRQVCEDVEVHAKDAQEEAQEKRLEALENVVQQIRRNNY
ncbi:hypothetical protein Tco_0793591 [Tanacetum coccineum]